MWCNGYCKQTAEDTNNMNEFSESNSVNFVYDALILKL